MKKILLFLSILLTCIAFSAICTTSYAAEEEEIELNEEVVLEEIENEILSDEEKLLSSDEEEVVLEENNNIAPENQDENFIANGETTEQTVVNNDLLGSSLFGSSTEKEEEKPLEENQPIKNGKYQIVSAISENKVLDIEGNSTTSGANIYIFDNCNQNNQKFNVVYEDDYYTIESVSSGKVLDVAGGSTASGTNVWQWEKNGTDAQKWRIVDAGEGYYYIISKCGDLYLDVAGARNANRTNIQVWEGNGSLAQKFRFVELPSSNGTKILSDGYYQIASVINENKVLNIEVPYNISGANLNIYDNKEQNNQIINAKYNGDGTYTLIVYGSNKALDVAAAGKTSGTNVHQWETNGTEAQKWVIKDSGDGSFYIISACNDLYLDLYGAGTANGNNIHVWAGNGTLAQKFLFKKYTIKGFEKTIEDGYYQIATALNTGKILDIAGASNDSGANVYIYDNLNLNNQKYKITYNNNFYTIVSIASGKALDVAGRGTTSGTNVWQWEKNDTDAQKWYIKDAGDGYFYIISKCNNLYLDVAGASQANGANVHVWAENGSMAQKFKFIELARNGGAQIIEDGYYQIASAINENKVLNIEVPYNISGANLNLYDNKEQNNQIINAKYNGDGTYTLIVYGSNKALDVAGRGTTSGTNVHQWETNGTEAQKWVIKNSGDGSFYIISACNDLYLDIAGAGMTNGTNVHMWAGNGTAAQKFLLKEYEIKGYEKTIEDGYYQIATALNTNKVLDVAGGSRNSGANIYIYDNVGANNQKFKVTYVGDYYIIESVKSEKVIDVDGGGRTSGTNVWQWEKNDTDPQKWYIKDAGDGYFYIISKCNNLYLDVAGASTANGANIHVWVENGSTAQKFKFLNTQVQKVFRGIDVSEWNGDINWSEVAKTEDFAIIRVGYRGYRYNNLKEDSKFKQNIEGALSAGVQVGAYFFTQAINEEEAIEEANYTADKLAGYFVSYPVAIDVEWSNNDHDGRADGLDVETRTKVVKAFLDTIKQRGYTPMIYANKTWLKNYLDLSKLQDYDVWLAHYTWSEDEPSDYSGNYTMWQYSSKEKVNGITGNVDKNVCYYNY